MCGALLAATLIAGLQGAGAADRPPRALIQLRDAAVAAWHPALAGQWAIVHDQLTAMHAAIEDLSPQVGKADLRQQLRGRIEAVEHAVRDRRAADAAANVNWVARIAEEMAARYEPGVPPDVRLLAFYGRAAEADAAAHRTDRVKADLADAETVWRRVEPMVLQRRAPDAARQFSDALVRLEGDHANDIREAADAEVTAANRIAELFARPARP